MSQRSLLWQLFADRDSLRAHPRDSVLRPERPLGSFTWTEGISEHSSSEEEARYLGCSHAQDPLSVVHRSPETFLTPECILFSEGDNCVAPLPVCSVSSRFVITYATRVPLLSFKA
jgi:hypothetical protein